MVWGPFREIPKPSSAVKRRLSDRAALVWGVVWVIVSAASLVAFWVAALPVPEPMWSIIVFTGAVTAGMLTISVSKIDATLKVGPSPAVLFVAAQSTGWAEALALSSTALLITVFIRNRNWADAAEVLAYLLGSAMASLGALHWTQSMGMPWPISAVVFVTVYLGVRMLISTIRLLVVTDLGIRSIWRHTLVSRVLLSWVAISVATILGETLRLLIAHINPSINTFWSGAILIILFGIAAAALAAYQETSMISRQLEGTLAAANALPWDEGADINTHVLRFARLAMPGYGIEVQDRVARNINEIVAPLSDGYLVARRGASQRPFLVQDQHVLDAIAHISVAMAATQQERETLARSATTDDLTGLTNYRGFRQFLALTADTAQNGFAVVYVDVDHFKDVNDTHGHEVGNTVLRTLASRLRSQCSPDDQVARIGGDEFVLVLTGVSDEHEAELRVKRLLAEVSAPIVLRDTVIAFSLSWGIAFARAGEGDIAGLVEAADARMYAARGRQVLGEDSAAAELRTAQDVTDFVDAIEAAIHERRLAVTYQPIVDAIEDRIVGFEALIRPNDPALTGIPAGVIVHEAQRLGLLTELSIHVIDTAVRDLLRFQEIAPELARVNVNIDVEQLTDPAFLDAMTQAKSSCGVGLALELSETSLNRSSADLHREMNRLREESNVVIALDDFGRHSSTLLSLLQYQAEVLKIDKALIADVHLPKQQVVIRSLVALTGNLDMFMVVEGVEDRATCDELVDLGVRYMQGHHFGTALSADDVLQRLSEQGLRARIAS